jgi:hypothetical protein
VIDAIADDDADSQHPSPALATRFKVHGLCHARLWVCLGFIWNQ